MRQTISLQFGHPLLLFAIFVHYFVLFIFVSLHSYCHTRLQQQGRLREHVT